MTSRNQSITRWMLSVVVGTYAGAWGFATVSALWRGGLVRWALLMAICSGLAAAMVVLLGAVDVLLLWLKARRLPEGREAWIGAIASSTLTLAALHHWPFSRWLSPVGFVSSLLPMVGFPLVIRLLRGQPCENR